MAKNQVKLSKRAIEALPPASPGKRDTYGIQDHKGLELRVTPNGVKTFSLVKRVKGGVPERVTLGKFGEIPLEQVKSKALTNLAAMADGKSMAGRNRLTRSQVTLKELFDDFLEHRQNRRGAYLSEVTKRGYRYDFANHLSKLENRQLSAIRGLDIDTLHKKIGKTHKTGANRVLALVSSLYSYAIERKFYQGPNPAQGIKKFPEDSRERVIEPDEMPKFFDAVLSHSSATIRDFVLICLFTGARRSNVLSMRWSDVNLDRGVWIVPRTKGGVPQTVALPAPAVEILKARQENVDSEFVFPGTGKSGHLTEPKKGWDEIRKSAGLPDLRLHDLRRTFGSWQANAGASLHIVGKSLGHKSAQSTQIYARLNLEPVRASVDNATALMLEAAGFVRKNGGGQ
ncbi:MAG: site-specific integrase [Pseudomonadota bacterium]